MPPKGTVLECGPLPCRNVPQAPGQGIPGFWAGDVWPARDAAGVDTESWICHIKSRCSHPSSPPRTHCLTLNLSTRRLRAVGGRTPEDPLGHCRARKKGEARSGRTEAGRGTSREVRLVHASTHPRIHASTHPRLRDRLLGLKQNKTPPSSQLAPSTTLLGSVVSSHRTRQAVRDPLPNGFASTRRLSSAAPVGSWRILALAQSAPNWPDPWRTLEAPAGGARAAGSQSQRLHSS